MEIRLKRSPDDGIRTLGRLNAGQMVFATLERPWIENPAGAGGMPRKSCVPRGTYRVEPWSSANFPDTFIITNPKLGVYRQPGDIPPEQKFGRSAILIHIGNRVRDVIGCIALGMEHGTLPGHPEPEPAVLRSGAAMRALNSILGRGSHTLVIE